MTEKREKKSTKHPPLFTHIDKNEVNDPIWWLASYPKSGNTWLRMFLTAYSTHGRVDINNPGVTTSDQHPMFYQMSTCKPLGMLTDCEIMHLRPAMLQNVIAVHPRRPLYMKTHNCFATVDHIPLIPPSLTMGATYIIRDPRDVAVSYSDHMGVDLDKGIDFMLDPSHRNGDKPILHVVSRWDHHVESWAQAPERAGMKVGVVKYEDILADPQGKFMSILEHMGVSPVSTHAYYATAACSFKSLRGQEDESGFKERTKHQDKFFRQGTSGGWKTVLTKKQANLIEKEFGPTMERFGYAAI